MQTKVTKIKIVEGLVLGPFQELQREFVGILLPKDALAPERKLPAIPAPTPLPKPQRQTCSPVWRHPESETPPEQFKYGPVEGSLRNISSWLFPELHPDRRRLQKKVENGVIWIQEVHPRLHRVWFRHQNEYELAKRQAAAKQPQRSGTPRSVKRHEAT
mgnify:CR=1 FL=1